MLDAERGQYSQLRHIEFGENGLAGKVQLSLKGCQTLAHGNNPAGFGPIGAIAAASKALLRPTF